MKIYAKIANLFVVIASMILLFVCMMDPNIKGDGAAGGSIAAILLCFMGVSNLTYNKDL